MIINFYKTSQLLLLLVFTYKFYWLHTSGDNQYANTLDFFSRTTYGDFYVNLLYFWWTSFWYLPLFVTSLLFFYSVLLNTVQSPKALAALVLYTLFAYEILDYWSLSNVVHATPIDSPSFNPLLTNSINKYHPLILYYSVIVLVGTNFTSANTQKRFDAAKNTTSGYIKYGTTVLAVSGTLALGSWWALQEGSWGGWWNWDPSEVFGLVVMIYSVRKLHLTPYDLRQQISQLLNKVELLTLIILYFFIQLNFDLVSHNFGTRTDQFIDSTHYLIAVLLLVVGLLRNTVKHSGAAYLNSILVVGSTGRYTRGTWARLKTHQTTLFVLITCLLYMSFNNLLNDFLWKTFSVNIANTSHQFPFLVTSITILLFSNFWKINHNLILIPSNLALNLNPLGSIIMFFTKKPASLVRTFHLGLLLFLLVNISNYFLLENVWSLTSQLGTKLLNFGHNVTTSSTILEGSQSLLWKNTLSDSAPFLLTDGLSSKSRTFSLLLDASNTAQSLPTGLTSLNFTINVLDTSLPPLATIFIVSLVVYSWVLSRKNQIMF